MRRAVVIAVLLFCLAGCASSESGHTVVHDRNCLERQPNARSWRPLAEAPEQASEIRSAAFRGVDVQRAEELWFQSGDRYLICQPGVTAHGCGQVITVVSRTASGWSASPEEMTLC